MRNLNWKNWEYMKYKHNIKIAGKLPRFTSRCVFILRKSLARFLFFLGSITRAIGKKRRAFWVCNQIKRTLSGEDTWMPESNKPVLYWHGRSAFIHIRIFIDLVDRLGIVLCWTGQIGTYYIVQWNLDKSYSRNFPSILAAQPHNQNLAAFTHKSQPDIIYL